MVLLAVGTLPLWGRLLIDCNPGRIVNLIVNPPAGGRERPCVAGKAWSSRTAARLQSRPVPAYPPGSHPPGLPPAFAAENGKEGRHNGGPKNETPRCKAPRCKA